MWVHTLATCNAWVLTCLALVLLFACLQTEDLLAKSTANKALNGQPG